MRPSSKMRNLGDLLAATMVQDLRRCQHPQAEPVILSTGEQVACVCITCFGPLPADYVEQQAETAHREAYCTHEDLIEVTAFSKADRRYTCTGCGSWLSDSTWPTLHPGRGDA